MLAFILIYSEKYLKYENTLTPASPHYFSRPAAPHPQVIYVSTKERMMHKNWHRLIVAISQDDAGGGVRSVELLQPWERSVSLILSRLRSFELVLRPLDQTTELARSRERALNFMWQWEIVAETLWSRESIEKPNGMLVVLEKDLTVFPSHGTSSGCFTRMTTLVSVAMT